MTRAAPPWERLKDVASKRRDVQAQRLAELVRARDEAVGRLDMLQTYRADYEGRLAAASRGGIDREALRNYQSFLAQLERAITQQAEIVGTAERNVDGAKDLWASERKRVESFRTLDERHLSSVAQDELRRTQKLSDEWAARSVAHAAPSDADR